MLTHFKITIVKFFSLQILIEFPINYVFPTFFLSYFQRKSKENSQQRVGAS